MRRVNVGDAARAIYLRWQGARAKKIPVYQRVEFYKDNPLLDATLLVNEKNRGVANVIIWLHRLKNTDPLNPIHPSFDDSKEDAIEITSTARSFEPRIAVMRTSQKLQLVNGDTVGHNFRIEPIRNRPFNILVPTGAQSPKVLPFPTREHLPIRVSSSLYPWIYSFLAVSEHPYIAVSDTDGRFEIKNLPTGTWTFRTWHERAGYLRDVVRGMNKETWKRGQFELTITEGDKNNLREIYIPAKYFHPD